MSQTVRSCESQDAAPQGNPSEMTRREFVQSSALAGAGLIAGLSAWETAVATGQEKAAAGGKPDELAIAIIGAGSQGRNLLNNCLKIDGVRFVAICDIWPYHQKYAAGILRKYDQPVDVYENYRELLDQEKRLDAVIVATPDWMHAEHTIACLNAGKHVYCEKEMSNTIEGSRKMVQAARETKKLLQIGHQRRSNPRYWHAIKLIDNDKVLGRITHCYGQWNRARLEDQGWPDNEVLSAEVLKRYGYDSMEQFRNWRWYKRYAGGPMVDLGSHQVDVFNWVLKARPKSMLASGGRDYYTDREWPDNVLAIYEYQTAAGPVRAFYQVLNTSSHGGYYEAFMGDEGSMEISEDTKKGLLYREVQAPKREWENMSEKIESLGREAIELKIGETLTPEGKKTAEAEALLEEVKKPVHQLHLENFFNAIRTGSPLSCPPEVGFETAVCVLKANEAVESGCRVQFDPKEFQA
jgi:predicted dehydrogenase